MAVNADIVNRAKNAVSDYVVKRNSDWKGGRIVVSIKGGEKFFDKFASDENAKISVPLDYQLTKVTSSLFLPIMAESNGRELGRTMVIAQIEVYKDVVVASNALSKGKKIGESDLEVKTQDISAYQGKYFTSADDIAGKITKTTIQQGSVVLDWMIKEEPVVAKGSPVQIRVASGSILVEASGVALADGQMGELIPVRRDDSQEEFKARVIASDTVEVKI